MTRRSCHNAWCPAFGEAVRTWRAGTEAGLGGDYFRCRWAWGPAGWPMAGAGWGSPENEMGRGQRERSALPQVGVHLLAMDQNLLRFDGPLLPLDRRLVPPVLPTKVASMPWGTLR